MHKFWATIKKDLTILAHDRMGMIFMFIMPVILAVVIAAIQNSTFQLVNDNKIDLLLNNRDTGNAGREFVAAVEKIGMFKLIVAPPGSSDESLIKRMHDKDALLAVVVPPDFTQRMLAKATATSGKALNHFGAPSDSIPVPPQPATAGKLTLYYHPVLQESFRQSVQGALTSIQQLIESKQILRTLYFSLNETTLPDSLEKEIINTEVLIDLRAVSRDGSQAMPNATQHNIPAWTIFAMFFVVISLGSSIVREKRSGSFLRLKTLPTNYLLALLSKQITYILVTLLQAAVIFSIGIYLFPKIGLPALNLPADLFGLLIITLICGWCAVSFAVLIAVFSETEEQANGVGAVSVILMAAIGGIMVPSFAMPASFKTVMHISPLHWCLEAFYGLFLEGGKLNDIWSNILPLIIITLLLQGIALWGLRRKHLI